MRAFSVFLAALLFAPRFASAEQLQTDGIAALVNDAIVTYQDVEQLAGNAIELLIAQYRNQPEILRQRIADTRAEATEQLIERQLILSEYKAQGYNIPESIIEDTIQERIKADFRDRVTMMQTLKQQGITYETYRKRVREEIIIKAMRVRNLNSDNIIISPQRILAAYEQNQTNYAVGEQAKLRMIMLSKKDDKGTAKQLAEEILRKLNEGASFREMAKLYSEGNRAAAEGDWGWAERSTLRKELADVAFSLKPGERSGVIELNDSVWIILVEDKRTAHTRPLAEVRDEIERTLKQNEAERLRKKWIARLKDKSFVRYF